MLHRKYSNSTSKSSGGGGYFGGLGSTNDWTNQSGQTYWNSQAKWHVCAGKDGQSYKNGCYQTNKTGSNTTHTNCNGHNPIVTFYSGHTFLGYCNRCNATTTFTGSGEYYHYINCNGGYVDGGQCNWGEATCTVCGNGTGKQPKPSPGTYNCGGKDDTTYYNYYVKSCGCSDGTTVLSCLGGYAVQTVTFEKNGYKASLFGFRLLQLWIILSGNVSRYFTEIMIVFSATSDNI